MPRHIRGKARLALTLVAALGLVAAAPAPPPARPSATTLSAEAIVRGVRRAVGAAALPRLGPAIEIVDARDDGKESRILLGTRHGEYRTGDENGYDGRYRWQMDSRRGRAIPNALRQHEKATWPLWVRDHWWLQPASGIVAKIIPAESDASRIALSLSEPGGVVPATLYIDRATMLPQRLVVPYDRGPFEARYSQWKTFGGVLFAGRVDSSYRDKSTVTVRAVQRAPSADFAAPAPPDDTAFDPRLPATVPIRRAPDFAGGQRGHSFARATLDGSESGWWLVDSGSDGMLIDEKLADRLGMPVLGESRSVGADGKPRRATWRRGKTFTVGRLTYRNPLFLAVDLSDSTAPPGERRAGVIGYDVFARAVVEYGRDGDQFAVCDPSSYRPAAGTRWQSLDFIDQTPAVVTRIEGGRTGLFQIDTGSAGAADFYKPFVEANHLLEGRETREVQSVGSGGAFTMRAGNIGWIELGGHRFSNVEVGFRMAAGRDGAGVLGRELLKPFTTVFDYSRRRIAFVPQQTSARTGSRCG